MAVLDVSYLVSIALTDDYHLAHLVDPTRILAAQSVSKSVIDRRRILNVPMQSYFGVYLVDVLSAGATASRERESKFGEGDARSPVDD